MRTSFPTMFNQGGAFRAEVSQDAADVVAAKLAKLEAVRERMRKVNTLVRNRNAKGLKRLGYPEAQVLRLLQPDSENRCAFYTDYKLRQNYQQIVALRRRFRELEAREHGEVQIDQDGYLYREDAQSRTISFAFSTKPDKAMRAMLRRAGFMLRPSRNTYERALDGQALDAAAMVREQLTKRAY